MKDDIFVSNKCRMKYKLMYFIKEVRWQPFVCQMVSVNYAIFIGDVNITTNSLKSFRLCNNFLHHVNLKKLISNGWICLAILAGKNVGLI